MNDPIYNARSIQPRCNFRSRGMKAVARVSERHAERRRTEPFWTPASTAIFKQAGRAPDRPIVAHLPPVSLHDPDVKEATTHVSPRSSRPLGAVRAPIEKRLQPGNDQYPRRQGAAEKPRPGTQPTRMPSWPSRCRRLSTIAQPERLGLGMLPANVLISNVRGPGETPVPERCAARGVLSRVDADRGRRAQRDLHVLCRSGHPGLYSQRLRPAGGGEPGEVHTQEAFESLENATAQRKLAETRELAAPLRRGVSCGPGHRPPHGAHARTANAYLLNSSTPLPSLPFHVRREPFPARNV